MSELRAWLESVGLTEETVTIKGKEFLVTEIDMAERGRLFAKFAKTDSEITNGMVEGLMMSRCVLDPATREQLVPCEQWQVWQAKGCTFAPLLRRVLAVNGMGTDEVEDERKNSDATAS